MKLEVKVDVVKFFLLFLSFVLLALGLGVACCGVWICFDSGSLIGAVSSVLHSTAVDSVADPKQPPPAGLSAHSPSCTGVKLGACCGLTDSSDWLRNSFVQMLNTSATRVLPCSCFRSHRRNLESTPWCSPDLNVPHAIAHANRTHTQGCGEQLSDWLHENIVTIVGADVCLMVAQVLQLALAVELWRILRTTNKMTDADHAHVGHTATRSDDADSAHWVPSRPVDF
ncbi:tetraspanin-12-like [Phycodurus eques]|uniref:tetraspanin-12-like n=1 Tax=Phycodurus eques TaxID=693459 RepID=UPI002ACE5E64|nr:tetraspanin-12-like [Phycodurus eques]